MDLFNVLSGVASILGLLVSIAGLIISGCTLYRVTHKDYSHTKNTVKDSMIGGDYTGRDHR